jgi:hypothetical protein
MMPFLRFEKRSQNISVRTCAPFNRAYAAPSMNSDPFDITVVSSAQAVGALNT